MSESKQYPVPGTSGLIAVQRRESILFGHLWDCLHVRTGKSFDQYATRKQAMAYAKEAFQRAPRELWDSADESAITVPLGKALGRLPADAKGTASR